LAATSNESLHTSRISELLRDNLRVSQFRAAASTLTLGCDTKSREWLL